MSERPPFGFDQPFIVSRPGGFTLNGSWRASGTPLDWRAAGLTEAEIWDLWALGDVDTIEGKAEPDVGESGGSVPSAAAAPLANSVAIDDLSDAELERLTAPAAAPPPSIPATAPPPPNPATAPRPASPRAQPASKRR